MGSRKDESGVLHSVVTLPRQNASPGSPVRCNRDHIQHERSKTGNARVRQACQRAQPLAVLVRNVRLREAPEDLTLMQQGILLVPRQTTALATDVGAPALPAERLIRSDVLAQDAEPAHHSPRSKLGYLLGRELAQCSRRPQSKMVRSWGPGERIGQAAASSVYAMYGREGLAPRWNMFVYEAAHV